MAESAESPLRGMCTTTPKRGHASQRALAATCHTVHVASITRRAELAKWLWDPSKITLPVRTLRSPVAEASPADLAGGLSGYGLVRLGRGGRLRP
jgi:hypothetical protein